MLAFNHEAGVVLSGDLGATHSRVGVTDLGGHVLAQTTRDIAIAEGPDTVLAWEAQLLSCDPAANCHAGCPSERPIRWAANPSARVTAGSPPGWHPTPHGRPGRRSR
jgi:hypothetical protein